MLVWALTGLGFLLHNSSIPFILASKGAEFGDRSTNITYRSSLIIALLGVPGALLGGLLVEIPRFGRKGTLAAAATLTRIFLYASTTARAPRNYWEVLPTKDRGTGNALAATANRIFGIVFGRLRFMADSRKWNTNLFSQPVITMFANLRTPAPVYISGALFLTAAICVVLLPFESRGRASL
ncbi:hypothetical protein NA57DRAFT_67325 [Rhizodiscina lignyota]|uniref:MFS transporter n=1 Tax=Rhizodiscina lignyota TaxID=1504668 RepID=A0A9P4IEB7_9PEZI|nr:hypothetical protein NA57DRAFT_67325 [Rhizodiscina lignyota]